MLKKLLSLCCITIAAATASAQLQETSFYAVRPTSIAPQIDGKGDDPAWENAARHTNYYKYLDQAPGPSSTKTEFRMLYDEKGIYLLIINYGDSSKLKAEITGHDNPSLWTDDCAEIYFDHAADGIAFRKFMANSKGVIADLMRLDLANTIDEWSAIGWECKTSVEPDKWIIESFFPWEDLGKKAYPKDIWMFCHCRYSMGIWVLSTSSPGGGFYNTSRFGFIYFAPDMKPLPATEIAKLINSKAKPPWGFQIDGLLFSNSGDGVKPEKLSLLVKEAEEKRASMFEMLKKEMPDPAPKHYSERLEKIEKALNTEAKDLARVINQNDNEKQLEALYWDIKLDKDFK